MKFFSPPNPPPGTNRICKAFLWLPMKLGNETRWLETACWQETFFEWRWNPIQWIDHVHDVGQSFPIELPPGPVIPFQK